MLLLLLLLHTSTRVSQLDGLVRAAAGKHLLLVPDVCSASHCPYTEPFSSVCALGIQFVMAIWWQIDDAAHRALRNGGMKPHNHLVFMSSDPGHRGYQRASLGGLLQGFHCSSVVYFDPKKLDKKVEEDVGGR